MEEAETYFAELVSRIRTLFADELVGVYVGGSFALGAYEPGRSDLDVAAVSRDRVPVAMREAVVAAVRHESLPCPARGLELVLYSLAAVRAATADPGFDLNLNTGASMPFRVDLEPVAEERHWFALDRSILAERGVALFGPPAGEVFAPLPRELVLPLLAHSLRWYEGDDAPPGDAVLNACRSLRYAREGVWSSKPAAGEWALTQVEDAGLVRDALTERTRAERLDPTRVVAFVRGVLSELAGAVSSVSA